MTLKIPFLTLLTLFLSSGTCITQTGCSTDSVRHAFGYTEPALQVQATQGLFGGGVKFKASSQFSGNVDAEIDPETQRVKSFSARIDSNVTDVYDAQGRRITENFLAGRSMEYNFKLEQQKLANEFGFAVVNAIQTLGPDIVKGMLTGGTSAGLDIAGLTSMFNALLESKSITPTP